MENNSIKAERAILGLLLENPLAINKVKGYINYSDFFDVKHQMIYKAIEELSDNNIEIEVTMLVQALKANKLYEKIGKEDYLFELIKSAALESNLTKYIKLISDEAQLREVKKVLSKSLQEIEKNPEEPNDFLSKIENDFFSITRSTGLKDFQHSREIVKQSMDIIEKRAAGEVVSGVETEFPSLDNITSGFQAGDLIILAARPSMGKTAFALNMAANVAKTKNVAFFSLEMPSEQLINRVLSSSSFINAQKLRDSKNLNTKEWTKLHSASEQVAKLDLYIDDTPGLKLNELLWKAKKLHQNHKLDLILIDYMQLIVSSSHSKGDNRQAEVSAISRALKQLARELKVPVIALSQLSRRVEQRENKTPMMSDLRESGAIEQDADLIMFLYRDAYYNKNDLDENQDLSHQETDIIISKHRNGATGKISLTFNPSFGLFSERKGNK